MATLYEITDEYQATFTGLEALRDSGEIDDATLQDTLVAVATEYEEKAINVGYHIQNMKSDLAELKSHKQDIDAKIKTLGNRIEWYQEYLRESMIRAEKAKIESPLLKITLGKATPVVVVTDESQIPEQYKKVSVSIDRTALKAALKDEPVPGAELDPGKLRLTIK